MWQPFCFIDSSALFDEDYEVFARRPEYLRIVDAEDILVVGIAAERVAARWVHGEHSCRLGV